jgi:shikimate kinase
MKDFKRIILIGFRGTGKSTIGKILAKQINWNYISTDQMIEQKAQISISDIVYNFGWKKFRELEHEVIQSVAELTNAIIDCGGGVVEDSLGMEFFQSQSLVVWIDAELNDILSRISGDHNIRPLLNQIDQKTDTEKNYMNRRPLYQRYADLHFNSSQYNSEEICQFIQQEMAIRK